MSIEVVVYQLFRVCNIKVDEKHLEERLRAHPDYPSLAAITDLLEDWRLEHAALQIDRDDLAQMEFPFIAHVISKEGREDFRVIESRAQIDKEGEEFFKSWSGIVVWIAPDGQIKNQEHEDTYHDNLNKKRLKWLLGAIGACAMALILGRNFDSSIFVFTLLSIAGITIAGAIIGYMFGIDNGIAKSFCKITETGCHEVIHSRFSYHIPGLHLSDLALTYFSGLFLSALFIGINNPANYLSSMAPVVGLSALVSITSLTYQALKNEWCRMCLGISLVIWLQFALIGFHFEWQLSSINPDLQTLSFFLLAFTTGGTWWLAKPYVQKNLLIKNQNIKLRKWRQDPQWFQALLPLHKQVDTKPWEQEICYGNPEGVLQITLVSSPYCEPCARAHHELNHLVDRYPEDIGIQVRFLMKPTNKKDVNAALGLISAYEQMVWCDDEVSGLFQDDPGHLIHSWFENQNLKSFRDKFGEHAPGAESKQLLELHLRWANHFHIDQTPAFFVNGHEMPNPHTLKDLAAFLDSYIENLKAPAQSMELSGQHN